MPRLCQENSWPTGSGPFAVKPPSAGENGTTEAYSGHFLAIEGLVRNAKARRHRHFDGVSGRHDPHSGFLE
jgi:hypothetical protein